MKSPKRIGRVEEEIEEALKRGEFDNLKGKGRPLNLQGDFADAKYLGQKMRHDAGFGAPWQDVAQEIDGLTRRLHSTVRRARATMGEDSQKAWRDADELLKLVNSRILHFNLIIPPQLPHLYRARLKREEL